MADVPDTSRVLGRMQELDRRKLAAGRQANAEQTARRRAMWREGKARLARKAKQAQCEPVSDPVFDQIFGSNPPKIEPKPENKIRKDLVKLSRDARAPASARVTALRTLAEMDGLVGKLQTVANDTADQPLASLTREQLEEELARLRRVVAGDDS